MKRIQGTQIWTDGVNKYVRNDQNEMVLYVEETNVVELEEEVVLKPVDNSEEE